MKNFVPMMRVEFLASHVIVGISLFISPLPVCTIIFLFVDEINHCLIGCVSDNVNFQK